MDFMSFDKKIDLPLLTMMEIEKIIKKWGFNNITGGTSGFSFNIKRILSSEDIRYIQQIYYKKGWIIEKEDEGLIDSAFYTTLHIKKKYEVPKKKSRFEIMDID